MASEEINKESNLTYDDRRKELIQKKAVILEHKTEEVKDDKGNVTEKAKLLSTVNQSFNATYTEAGIKLALKNLSEERTFLEKRISTLKEAVKDKPKMTKELEKLKKDLADLQKVAKQDKEEAELESVNERFDQVKSEINELKDTIGDRLKL